MTILENGLAVCGTTHHASWLKTEGLEHDLWMCGYLEKLINRFSIKRVVNAGCHVGTLASVFLRRDCSVLAFDPNPEACACILHNLGHHETLTVENVALGDRTGVAYLHLNEENAGASYLTYAAGGGEPMPTVPVMELDAFRVSPDFLLLDCEGWEPKAIRGALNTIARCRPVMVLEVNEGALDRVGESREGLLKMIDGLGYAREIMQDGLGWDAPQYDILAVPR